MTKGKRAALTGIIGFIGYRIPAEFMDTVGALAVGVAVAVAVWLATGAIRGRAE